MEYNKPLKTRQKGYYAEKMREYRKRHNISNKKYAYILELKGVKHYFKRKSDIVKYIERVDIETIKDNNLFS